MFSSLDRHLRQLPSTVPPVEADARGHFIRFHIQWSVKEGTSSCVPLWKVAPESVSSRFLACWASKESTLSCFI